MTDASFIRKDMLPPAPPPVSERGVVKWAHENLFSGWLNTLLTVLGVGAVVWLVWLGLPWLLNGVWVAGSLGECRSIIAESTGVDVTQASGACWAVIRERWHQFLFGFFPQDQYWRPILAFALMLISLAPVLYWNLRKADTVLVGTVAVLTVLAIAAMQTDGLHLAFSIALLAALVAVAWFVPKLLVLLTLVFPFAGVFLLWGGSVWGPLAVMLGMVLTGLAVVWMQPRSGAILAVVFGVLAFACFFLDPLTPLLDLVGSLVSLFTETPFRLNPGFMLNDHFYDARALFPLQPTISGALHGALPWGLPVVDSDDFGGFLLAFVIGVTAIAASLPIGILLALGRRSDMPLVKTLAVGFIEFIRGVPLITMLFTASLLLAYFLPPGSNFDLIVRVIILVTLFASAYIAEVIRGGLAALPRGQYEAADALGLDYWQAQRLIIMPQALKISIPGIVSSFIGLFKDTTLVALVGLADPLQGITKIVRADINWKGVYWEPFLFVGAIFFIVCFSMSRYSMYLERKLKTDHR